MTHSLLIASPPLPFEMSFSPGISGSAQRIVNDSQSLREDWQMGLVKWSGTSGSQTAGFLVVHRTGMVQIEHINSTSVTPTPGQRTFSEHPTSAAETTKSISECLWKSQTALPCVMHSVIIPRFGDHTPTIKWLEKGLSGGRVLHRRRAGQLSQSPSPDKTELWMLSHWTMTHAHSSDWICIIT